MSDGKARPFKAKFARDVFTYKGIMEYVVAEHLGLTKSALSRKLNGNRPFTFEEMERVALLVKITVEDLFPECFGREGNYDALGGRAT